MTRWLPLVLLASATAFLWWNQHTKQLQQELDEAIRRDRWQQADQLAERLAKLGASIPETLQVEIRQQLRQLETQVRFPSSTYERAQALAQLDRFDDAAELLAPLLPKQPGAKRLLASIRQAQQRYSESDTLFTEVRIESQIWRQTPALLPRYVGILTGPALPFATREDMAERRRRAPLELQAAYDGLAYNARQRGQTPQAISTYRQALLENPGQAAYYWLRIGRTLEEAGQLREAVEAFSEASNSSDSTIADAAKSAQQRLLIRSRGCQLGSP